MLPIVAFVQVFRPPDSELLWDMGTGELTHRVGLSGSYPHEVEVSNAGICAGRHKPAEGLALPSQTPFHDEGSSNIRYAGGDIGCPSSPAHLRLFTVLKELKMLFLSPPSRQFCWVPCPVYAQEKTVFTCFQPLAQGDRTFIYPQEHHNDIHRTYKNRQSKEKIHEEKHYKRWGEFTSSAKCLLLFLHSSLTISTVLSAESFDLMQGPIQELGSTASPL